MAGWFELSKSKNDQFRFVLKAGNAETIIVSELYTTKAAAQNGRTRLSSSCAPVNRCRKRVLPRMGEPPARFVHPVKRAPCKSKFPKENPHAIG